MALWYALVFILAVIVVAIGALIFRRRHAASADDDSISTTAQRDEDAATPDRNIAATIPFQTDAIVEQQNAIYRLAFGVKRIDYRILGEHVRVLKATQDAVAGAMNEPRYFPRKPALLPKLLRAINTLDNGRHEIVRLILQDAVLAGNVLKRANSAYYRQSTDVVESIDRAVLILGNEGMRAPVASAIMQPVFQLPAGFFEHFAPITWEQARRTAYAAEEIARAHVSTDALVAHLAGMLGGLSRIVLFRLTMDKYRLQGNIMPRPEVFIKVMIDHEPQVARAIAAAWELSPAFIEAFDAQVQATPPHRMSPLASTVYYANLVGLLTTLHHHDLIDIESAYELLAGQGLESATSNAIWTIAGADIIE